MSDCLQLRPKAKAIGTATAKDILDKQRIEAEDYQKNLRIKREESQFPAVRYNVVIGGKAAAVLSILFSPFFTYKSYSSSEDSGFVLLVSSGALLCASPSVSFGTEGKTGIQTVRIDLVSLKMQ